jgi:hypothetical protein
LKKRKEKETNEIVILAFARLKLLQGFLRIFSTHNSRTCCPLIACRNMLILRNNGRQNLSKRCAIKLILKFYLKKENSDTTISVPILPSQWMVIQSLYC